MQPGRQLPAKVLQMRPAASVRLNGR